MGYKYEVIAWVYGKNDSCERDDKQIYKDVQIYAGRSLVKALWAMLKAKQNSGCVTFKWR